MVDEKYDIRNLQLRELMPWIHLFRGFRIALDFKKMALGALGAFLTAAGWWVIVFLFGVDAPKPLTAPQTDEQAVASTAESDGESNSELPEKIATYQAMAEAKRFPWQVPVSSEPDVFRSPLQPAGWIDRIPVAAYLVIYPIKRLIFPAQMMFQTVDTTFVGVLMALWTLVVWAFFGGAITRIAAVQVAREGNVGLSEAVRFVASRMFNYLAAPLLPLLAVLLIILFGTIGGLLTWIPGINVVMGVLWILPLLAGWIITIVLVGLAIGWPLMYAAISTEGTESFDAISRVYSYLLGRAWSYLFYAAVAILFGALLTTIIVTFAFLTVHFSQYAVTWGASTESIRNFYATAPIAGGWREAFGPAQPDAQVPVTEGITALFVGIWTHLLFMGIVGFAYSYFWSSSTIIYFLLRREVDDTDIEEVFLDEEEEEPFPTVAPTLGPPPESKGPEGSSVPISE